MRFFSLFLIAWLTNWIVTPAIGESAAPGFDLHQFLAAAVGGAFFSFLAWLYIRRTRPEEQSILITPTFAMIFFIALLGFGGAYGAAREAGMEPGAAVGHALLGPPGLMGAMGILGLLYLHHRKKSRA